MRTQPEEPSRTARRFTEQGPDAGITIAVASAGAVVFEESFGATTAGAPLTPAHRFLWLSASKPITAVAVGVLVDRGALGFQDPVARHVPEFAGEGRDRITLEHLLSHRAGIADFLGERLPAEVWHDWDTAVRACCALPLEHAPGAEHRYHPLSYGLLGEVVQRADGRPFARFVAEEIAAPLGMDTLTWGLPDPALPHTGIGLPGQAGTDNARRFQTPQMNAAVVPAGNAWGVPGDLLRFYTGLGRILSSRTLAQMTSRAYGFEVGAASGLPSVFGTRASPRTYGHPGMRSVVGWCDPDAGVAAAICCNGAPDLAVGQRRLCELSDAVRRMAAR